MHKTVCAALCGLLLCACNSPQKVTVTWSPQQSRLTASLRGLAAVNERIAWVSGSSGQYARTLDGGRTWQPDSVRGAAALDFRDVQAFSENVAYLMSAGPGTKSRIYKTTDGGMNWSLLYENRIEAAFYNGMAFWDENRGVVVSDPVEGKLHLLRTTDGGKSWQPIDAEGAPLFEDGEYGFAASGTNVAVWGNRHIWVGSGGSVARVFRSADAGKTWAVAMTPMVHGRQSTGIFSLAFRDSLHGVAVGGDFNRPDSTAGNVMLTDDSGLTWRLIDRPETVGYRSCVAYVPGLPAALVLAVGRSGCSFSLDAGATWQPISGEGYYTLSAGGPAAVWAAGSDGRVAKARIQ